jgi:hypothetical protein
VKIQLAAATAGYPPDKVTPLLTENRPCCDYVQGAAPVLKQQAQRREAKNNKTLGTKLWHKFHGMATLSTAYEPPAVKFDSTWSAKAVKEVVSTFAWERETCQSANIDIVQLARVVYSVEKGRVERARTSGPLAKLFADSGAWGCDDAIEAWLAAFRLNHAIDRNALEKGFEAGKTGYEHKGNGILTGYAAVTCTYLSMLSPELMAMFASARACWSIAHIYCDLMAGDERMLRKPHEDLAHVLSLKASKRSAVAPKMTEARCLAEKFHEASELAAALRTAVQKQDSDMVKSLLERADELFDKENRVKSALNLSAAEWASKRRELPTRAAAATPMAAAAIVSAVCPPAAPIALPAAMAASAAVHSAYHFSDAARRDARDKAKTYFFNRIKSYDWLDETRMPRSAIAELYGQFEEVKIDEATLCEKLSEANPFMLDEVCGAMRFPVEARIGVGGIAHKLLLGKLAERFDEEIVLREKFRGRTAPDTRLTGIAQRRLLADLINLLKANEAMKAESFDVASACLHAIHDEDVRKLLTGTMLEQSAAAARSRQLSKGERLKYRLMFAASSAPALAMGPVYGVATGWEQAFHSLAKAGASAGQVLPTTPALATAAALTPPLTGETMAAFDRFEHGQRKVASLHGSVPETQTAQRKTVTLEEMSVNQPVSALDIPEGAIRELIGREGMMPARFSIAGKGQHAEAAGMCIDLTGTDAYYNAPRRSLNLVEKARMRLASAGAVGDILQQGLRAPFARWVVTRHAGKTRQARNNLRQAVREARNALRP